MTDTTLPHWWDHIFGPNEDHSDKVVRVSNKTLMERNQAIRDELSACGIETLTEGERGCHEETIVLRFPSGAEFAIVADGDWAGWHYLEFVEKGDLTDD
jgi:hypothetical protein